MTLDRNNIEDIIALTPLQKGLLFHSLKDPDSRTYVEQISLHWQGAIDKSEFSKAWASVLASNELLRTIYHWEGVKEPLQIILKVKQPCITFYDLLPAGETRNLSAVRQLETSGISLDEHPFRIALYQTAEKEFTICLTNHHILYDGWSSSIIIREFCDHFSAIRQGRAIVSQKKLRFKDFIKWQLAKDQAGISRFYSNYLDGFSFFDIFARLRTNRDAVPEPAIHTHKLQPAEFRKAIEFCKRQSVSFASLIYAAWGIFLSKYFDLEDLTFGVTISGRPNEWPGIEQAVGLFINTLPLRMKAVEGETVAGCLQKVSNAVARLVDNDVLSLADIQRASGNSRLFDTLVVLQNYPRPSANPAGSELCGYEMYSHTHYDLTLAVFNDDQKAELDFTFDRSMLSPDLVAGFAGHFHQLLGKLTEANKETRLNEISLLSEEETDLALSCFNSIPPPPTPFVSLGHLLKKALQDTGDRIALTGAASSFTGSFLWQRSENLADFLVRRKNITKGDRVAVMTGRSPETLTMILAILAAGAAFVPVNPAFPVKRINQQLLDAGVNCLLTDAETLSKYAISLDQLLPAGDNVLLMDEMELPETDTDYNLPKLAEDDLCYIMYTSGTSGVPKGVMIPHRAVVNYIESFTSVICLENSDVVAHQSALTFDTAIEEIFPALVRQARIVTILDEEKTGAPMLQVLHREKISVLSTLPSTIGMLDASASVFPHLRVLISGGETLHDDQVKRIGRLVELYNSYGPTETTICCTYHRVTPGENASVIGKPLAGYQVFICDRSMQLQPAGVEGEICIGGAGVANGYLNKPEETHRQFVWAPFTPNLLLYRTGDRGRWLEDGSIAYIGRTDHQVKINGVRIELQDIEHHLRCFPDIIDTAVLADKTRRHPVLFAFLQTRRNINLTNLASFLQERLPAYMIPTRHRIVDRLPVLSNGKLDRKALEALMADEEQQVAHNSPRTRPRTKSEQTLEAIWIDLLRPAGKEIHLDENFFELGGHSLHAISLCARLLQTFQVKASIRDIFSHPTIRLQSLLVDRPAPRKETTLTAYPLQDHYPLSYPQTQQWLLYRLDPSATAYNMPVLWALRGNLDLPRLERALQQLIHRHESLRTSFHLHHDDIRQVIHSELRYQLNVIEVRDADEALEKAGELTTPFDLSKLPLWRIYLLHSADGLYFLFLDMHHIIFDGISQLVMMRDFHQLYEGQTLAGLTLQYRDFAQWQQSGAYQDMIRQQWKFWQEMFTGELPGLELPLDWTRPASSRFEGDSLEFRIPASQLNQLRAIAGAEQSTLFMILLAIDFIWLSKLSGQEDLVIGVPVSGRNNQHLEGLIGMFVNILPLRAFPAGHKTVRSFFADIRAMVIEAFDHADVPFETMVEKLLKSRDLGRNPLFDTMFVWLDDLADSYQLGELSMEACQTPHLTAKFHLQLEARIKKEEIVLVLEYNTALFSRTTIALFVEYFQSIVQSVCSDTDIPLHAALPTDAHDILPTDAHDILPTGLHDILPIDPPQAKDSLIDLWAHRLQRFPDRCAAVWTDGAMTTRELEDQSNRMAALLTDNGIRPGAIVAVLLTRSIDMVVSLLGILKAGAAYLPLDPQYPPARIAYIIEDSRASLVISDPALSKLLPAGCRYLDPSAEDLSADLPRQLPRVSSNHLAYVLYTSGSTGRPKGVMISHSAVVNTLRALQNEYPVTPEDAWLFKTAFVFDVSVTELFGWIPDGGKMVILDAGQEKNPWKILRSIHLFKITHINFVPSMFGLFLQVLQPEAPAPATTVPQEISWLTSLQYIILAGEALTPSVVKQYAGLGIGAALVNAYGPTEASIYATQLRIDYRAVASEERVPIGKPLPNTQVCIINRYDDPLPPGLIGELCITGAGLAAGYLNNPQLTSEKFTFLPAAGGLRWYKTGDRARWLHNGELEFLGRIDDQMKIRGFRIEPGEIEEQLKKVPGIREAAVIRKQTDNVPVLAAFFVGSPDGGIEALRDFLRNHLPYYMVPLEFTAVDAFPRTASNKIDKKMLAAMGSLPAQPAPMPQDTPRIDLLLGIWTQILQKEKIDIYDDFFALGGDSIKAIRIVSRANAAGYRLDIRDIFQKPTIAQLARALVEDLQPVTQTPATGACILSPVQQWFFDWCRTDPHHYNQVVILRCSREIDEQQLAVCMSKLLEHHDVLRSVFYSTADGWTQEILEVADVPPNVLSFHCPDEEEEEQFLSHTVAALQERFDLAVAPLLTLARFRDRSGHRLVMIAHHLIIDAVSWRILLDDLQQLLDQSLRSLPLQLPPKTGHYHQWCRKLKLQADGQFFHEETSYWEDLLKSAYPQHPQPRVDLFRDAAAIRLDLDAGKTQLLKATAQALGISLEECLLTAFTTAFAEWRDIDHLVLALEGHGRTHDGIQLARTIGWFTSIYPIAINFHKAGLLRQFIEVKEAIRQTPAKGEHYGILRYNSGDGVKLAHHSGIVFNYLGEVDSRDNNDLFEWAGQDDTHMQSPDGTRPFAMEIGAWINSGHLQLDITYNHTHESADSLRGLIGSIREQLEAILQFNGKINASALQSPADFTYKHASFAWLRKISTQQEIEDIFPLTPMQKGMLFHHIYDKTASAYFEQAFYKITGAVDPQIVEDALRTLIARHGILRSNILHEDLPEPLMVQWRRLEPSLQIVDLTAADSRQQQIQLEALQEADLRKGFHLASDPLLRVTVFLLGQNSHCFLWSFHHVLLDGWSAQVMQKEFLFIYQRLAAGERADLAAPPDYRRYIRSLQEQKASPARQYWSDYLEAYEELTGIRDLTLTTPLDGHDSECLTVNRQKTRKLLEIAGNNKVTLSVIIHALWGVLLAKYNNSRDVVFGTVVSGRPPEVEGIDEMMGLFINTLPVRVRYDKNTRFCDLLTTLMRDSLNSIQYQYTPLADIRTSTPLDKELLDHILVFENYPIEAKLQDLMNPENKQLSWKLEAFSSFERNHYPFSITVLPGDILSIWFKYDRRVYTRKFIKELKSRMELLIDQVSRDEKILVAEMDILSVRGKKRLLRQMAMVSHDLPDTLTFPAAISEKAFATPDAVAITSADCAITYRELDETSNRMAGGLLARSKPAEPVIALCVTPSIDMMVSVLGIMKAGVAFFPVDPDHSLDRTFNLIKDAGIATMISAEEAAFPAPGLELLTAAGVELISAAELCLQTRSNRRPDHIVSKAQPAYMIATSGTTGTPKGTLVSHANLINYATWFMRKAALSNSDRSPLLTSMAFDLGYTSVFPLLLAGGTLHLPSRGEYTDPSVLLGMIEKERFTYLKLTPSLFSTLAAEPQYKYDKLRTLKLIALGGEELKRTDVTRLFSVHPGITVMNHYGPTETTIGTISRLITRADWKDYMRLTAIGRPIDNASARVINIDDQWLPAGIPGELFIDGPGVSLGYINRPELTADRFPSLMVRPATRVYRTGDKTFLQRNGEFVFMGRSDDQLKIRGYRIEPAEIEHCLLGHPDIIAVALTAHEKSLVAYIVAGQPLTEQQLTQFVTERLPNYMVPARFVFIERIPLTKNNKLDKKALPAPDTRQGNDNAFAGLSLAERKMAQCWEKVLHLPKGSLNASSHFFGIGGNSLVAIQLIQEVRKDFGISIPVRTIFEYAALGSLVGEMGKISPTLIPSLRPAVKKEAYRLSSAQKRLYLLQNIHFDNTAYNMLGLYRLPAQVDPHGLEDIFRQLIHRHEALRTSFGMKMDTPVQLIADDAPFSIEEIRSGSDSMEDIINRFIRPFDLAVAPLMRAGVIRTPDGANFLVLDVHHIISDGISNELLLRDFQALTDGKPLPSLPIQYKDYAEWQEEIFRKEMIREQGRYWLANLGGELPRLDLPTDYDRPAIQRFDGGTVTFIIDAHECRALRNIATNTGSTLFMVYLAIFEIFLSRVTGQQDIIVGIPVSGRNEAGLDDVVGCFINTLAIRTSEGFDDTFEAFVRQMKAGLLEAFDHQDYSFEDLVEELNVQRDISRNPLFDVMFDYHNEKDISLAQFKDMQPEHLFHRQSSMFDLNLHSTELDGGLFCELEYSTALFHPETVRNFSRYIQNLVSSVCRDHAVAIPSLSLLEEAAQREIIFGFNDTYAPYNRGQLIQKQIEWQAVRRPDRIAAQCGEEYLSYSALNEKANHLAFALRGNGLLPGDYAVVTITRSIEMIIAVLGILKAGGVYIPLEPTLPDARIAAIIRDLQVSHLVSCQELENRIKGLLADAHCVSHLYMIDHLPEGPAHNPVPVCTAEDLAYIIFTSGSTGTPKGVMVRHRPVINLIEWVNSTFAVDESDRLLFITALGFDLSVYDIFGILAAGASIYIATSSDLGDGARLIQLIDQEKITFWDSAPPAFQQCLPFLPKIGGSSLRLVFFSGDWIAVPMPDMIRKAYRQAKIISLGGATEATVWSNFYPIREVDPQWKSIPYGKPIQNARYYILDPNLNVCPIRISGDLYIGGECLSAGYINDVQLTRQKFIPDPFNPGQLMYKTGDLARWQTDGNMELLGRKDFQVKIRGYRIELGEIESQLMSQEGVETAIVIARGEKSADKTLIAYFIARIPIDTASLKERLARALPAYMIPAHFIQLQTLPITVNGKLDRNALPDPEIGTPDASLPPRHETDLKLQELWASILQLEPARIGINANFFELGGNSLKVNQLVADCHRIFNVRIPFLEIFQSPYIRDLADYITKARQETFESIGVAETAEWYPVSAAQQRLYLLHQLAPDQTGYHITQTMRLTGALDTAALDQAFATLIRRHEILRSGFFLKDGAVFQFITEKAGLSPALSESRPPSLCSSLSPSRSSSLSPTLSAGIEPFDLAKPPLIRAALVREDTNNWLLTIDLHHIIADGISLGIITEELLRLYKGVSLQPVRHQFKDYVRWSTQRAAKTGSGDHAAYWHQYLADIPVLSLPTDHARPSVRTFSGAKFHFALDSSTTHRLRQLAAQQDQTLFSFLFAIYHVFLFRITGQNDIITGTPVSTRNHADLLTMVGPFINTLAIRSRISDHDTLQRVTARIKDDILNAFAHSDYPFEELVGSLNIQRDPGRNPVFDTMFVFDEVKVNEYNPEGLTIQPILPPHRVSKFDLTLFMSEEAGRFVCNFEYSLDLFTEPTIACLAACLQELMDSVAATGSGDIQVSELEILPPAQTTQLLETFNKHNQSGNWPKDETIDGLFRRQVILTPDHIALIGEEECLTYSALAARVSAIAAAIAGKGMAPGDVVGLCCYPGPDMIAGILAILEAGGAYLPLSPKLPAHRLKRMLKDTDARVVIVQNRTFESIGDAPNILELDQLAATTAPPKPVPHTSDDLAYIIYTSGSTGAPKGTMITHANVLHTMDGFRSAIYKDEQLTISLTASYEFDGSVHVIFGALLYGHTLCIVPEERRLDASWLIDYYQSNRVNVLEGVPSYQQFFLSGCGNRLAALRLRHIICGGEALKTSLANAFFDHAASPTLTVTNIYGPTETCVGSAFYQLKDKMQGREGVVPLGHPMPAERIYILDALDRLVPIGVTGQICISGPTVAKGYLGHAELTAQKFTRDPFFPDNMMYHTGDYGSWKPDGILRFAGRVDTQIKLRGYRIEATEIEHSLSAWPAIRSAVVRLSRDGNNLCAWLVADGEVNVAALKEHLALHLPPYAIPGRFIFIHQIPLTSHGKTDYRALSELETEWRPEDPEYLAPRSPEEAALVEVWAGILRLPATSIGVTSNFFSLGGNSLNAAALAAKIGEQFGQRPALSALFSHATISRQIALLAPAETPAEFALTLPPALDAYPASEAQKRLYFIYTLNPSSIQYNLPQALLVNGPLDTGRLERAFQQLIDRHEILRTAIVLEDDEIRQKIYKRVFFRITIEEMTSDEGSFYREAIQPFDLAHPPLIRVAVGKQSGSRHFVVIDMHHIVTDGMSNLKLIRELTALYNGETLPPVEHQYKDFSFWQNSAPWRNRMQESQRYWTNTVRQFPAKRIIPPDLDPIGASLAPGRSSASGNTSASGRSSASGDNSAFGDISISGQRINFIPDGITVQTILRFCESHQVTPYMLFLGVYAVCLSRFMLTDDLVIGSPVAGRTTAGTQEMLGLFTNLLPIRLQPLADKPFTEFLRELRSTVLEAFDNQEYPFNEMVKRSGAPRSFPWNPLFSAHFSFDNIPDEQYDLPDISIHPWVKKEFQLQYEHSLYATLSNGCCHLTIEYPASLYSASYMQQFVDLYTEILHTVVQQPDNPLGAFNHQLTYVGK